eukprot:1154762-Pelagomonas_calceolata.AAC.2
MSCTQACPAHGFVVSSHVHAGAAQVGPPQTPLLCQTTPLAPPPSPPHSLHSPKGLVCGVDGAAPQP